MNDDFNADLKRAFAGLEDPPDAGFTAAVTHRVAGRERALAARGWLNNAAYAVAGGALAYALASYIPALASSLAPSVVEQVARVSDLYGGFAGGLRQATASTILPLIVMLGALAGVGGVAVARTVAD